MTKKEAAKRLRLMIEPGQDLNNQALTIAAEVLEQQERYEEFMKNVRKARDRHHETVCGNRE